MNMQTAPIRLGPSIAPRFGPLNLAVHFGYSSQMLSFLSNTRVYLAAGQTDLRKSFDTLAGVVRSSLQLAPLFGHLFVFRNQCSKSERVRPH